jgi:hypothetical protein
VQDAKGLSVAIVQPARWVRTGAGFVGRPAEGWWLELRLRLWLSRASASLAGCPAGGHGVVSRSSFDAGGERPRKASRGLVLQRCSERVTWPALLPHDFAALLSSVVAPYASQSIYRDIVSVTYVYVRRGRCIHSITTSYYINRSAHIV